MTLLSSLLTLERVEEDVVRITVTGAGGKRAEVDMTLAGFYDVITGGSWEGIAEWHDD